MLKIKFTIPLIGLLLSLCLPVPTQSSEVPGFTYEGEVISLSDQNIKIKNSNGVKEFIINKDIIFCKSGHRVYLKEEFVSSKFANIVIKKTENGLLAKIIYDTETEQHVSVDPHSGKLSMVQTFPWCTFRKAESIVKNMQILLNQLGYEVGPADGILGEKSQAALVDFQNKNQFLSTGIPVEWQLKKMREIVKGSGHTQYNKELERAAKDGNISKVKALLAKEEVDVNAKLTHGFTALFKTSQNGHTEIVNILKNAGAKE